MPTLGFCPVNYGCATLREAIEVSPMEERGDNAHATDAQREPLHLLSCFLYVHVWQLLGLCAALVDLDAHQGNGELDLYHACLPYSVQARVDS